MKTRGLLFACVALSISCIASIAHASLSSDLQEKGKIFVLREAQLGSASPEAVELNQDFILFDEDGDGEKEKVPVVFTSSWYDCIDLRVRKNGNVEERGANRGCYELRSVSKLGTFSWTVCADTPKGRFRLFTSDDGRNYLAWVGSYSIYITEITEQRDKVVALAEFMARKERPEIVYIPVGDLLGKDPFRGTNVFFSPIYVESIIESKDGTVTVKFKGRDRDKVYTLVKKKGGEWYDPDKNKD